MNPDDGKRSEKALLLSLQILHDGRIRIVFDDVSPVVEKAGGTLWKADSFFTHADVLKDKILDFDFSDDELRDFAEMTLARLRAYLSVSMKGEPEDLPDPT